MHGKTRCHAVFLLILLLSIFLYSCQSTTADYNNPANAYGLTYTVSQMAKPSIITGSVDYTDGFYIPSGQDMADITLTGISLRTYEESILSNQRIRNVQRFPLQFTLRFDENELSPGFQYIVRVVFTDAKGIVHSGETTVDLLSGTRSIHIII